MHNNINRDRHLPRLLALFSILTLLIVPSARAAAATVNGEQPVRLDLAAMALTPGDLEQAGFKGYGVASVDADSSGWRALGDVAADSVAGNFWLSLETPEALNVNLAQDGWQRQYRRVLAQPDPVDPTSVNLSVRSEIGEYADAAGADDALTRLMEGGTNESPGDLPIGDRLEVRSDLDPNVGARLVVAFRDGNLIGSVEVVRYASDEDPEIDPALLLARQLKARIDAEMDPNAPGLTDAAIRLSTLAAPAEYEGYMRRDGESFIEWGESQNDFAARDAAYGDAIDVYQLEQDVAPTSKEVVQPYFVDRLYRFPYESSAQDMLDQTPDRLAIDAANSDDKFDPHLVEDATPIGDDSLTFEIKADLDAGTSLGYRIYVRVGSDVARLQLDSSNEPSIQNAEALATAQASCLKAGSCAAAAQQPVSLPGLDCPPTHENDLVTDYAYAEIAPSPMYGVDPARSGAQPGPAPTGEAQGLWSVDVHGGVVTGPVISNGLLVFGSSEVTPPSDPNDPFAVPTESDYLFAFDPTSGFKWCAPTGKAIADPSVDNGLVFTESSAITGQHQQTNVVALDVATGVEQW
jgi:hypothetical protein